MNVRCFSFLASISILTACGGGGTTVIGGSPDGHDAGVEPAEEVPRDPSNPSLPPPSSSPDGGPGPVPGPGPGIDATLVAPAALGGTASAELVLSQLQKMPGLGVVSCPTYTTATDYPYVYVEVKNTTSQRVLTSIWASSGSASTSNTSDRMAVYQGATKPVDRTKCLGAVVQYCNASPCVGYPGFSSGDGHAVEIPAGESTLVYVSGTSGTTGSFRLNVRSELFF